MSLSAQVLDALVASGLSAEQLANVIKADMAAEAEKAARQVPWAKLREMAFARDGECCGYCGTLEGPFEIDHIIPRANGGENLLENVCVSCRSCNRAKKDRDGEEWRILSDRRAKDRERKRLARGGKPRKSADVQLVRGQSEDILDLPPNDIYSNPPLDAKASCPPLAERVVDAWNEGPGKAGATTAKPLDAGRRKALSTRIRDHSETEVFEAIKNLGQSAWHCGKNDRGWRVNIGWLLKNAENFQKALEMGGDDPPVSSEPVSYFDHLARKYDGDRKAA